MAVNASETVLTPPSSPSLEDSHPQSLPPKLTLLPRCFGCGTKYQNLTRFIVKPDNPNGNALRPYVKCIDCNKFVTWLDKRGIDDTCPACCCKKLCRRQVAGKYGNKSPRALHYVCSLGICNYYEVCQDEDGDEQVATDELMGLLARLNII